MLNRHLSALVDQLRAEGIGDPLAQSFTLAAIWDDLAAIVGESPPAAVQAALGGERLSPCTPSDSALWMRQVSESVEVKSLSARYPSSIAAAH